MKKIQKLFLTLTLVFSGIGLANADGASGTGFFVSSNGYIATNYHVVAGAERVGVILRNGKTLDAQIVRVDTKNDLAILKVDGNGYKALNIQPSLLVKRGFKSYAMGFPLIEKQGIEPKLTDGIISSLTGTNDEPTRFQISNPIQPGNSGGPLFGEDGKVIGVVVATLGTLETVNDTGKIPQNINYAVKSSYLIELLNTIEGLKYNKTQNVVSNTPKKLVDIVQDVDNGTVLIIAIYPNKPEAKEETAPVPKQAPKQSTEKPNTPPSIPAPPATQSSQTLGICAIANDKNAYGTACSNAGVNAADSGAINNCGKSGGQNCKIVAHFVNGCMAVAKDRTLDVSGYSYGEPTLEEAKKDAIISCEGHWGKNCEITPNNGCFNNK